MKSRKGFTLIELIVVIAILAIIAAVAVPTAFGSIERAREASDNAQVDAINSAIRLYCADELLNNNGEIRSVKVSAACKGTGMDIGDSVALQSKTAVVTWEGGDAASETPGYYSIAWTGTSQSAIDTSKTIFEAKS